MAEGCPHVGVVVGFNEGKLNYEELDSCLDGYDDYHHCLLGWRHLQVKDVLEDETDLRSSSVQQEEPGEQCHVE